MLIIKKRGGASDVSADNLRTKIMGLRLHIDEDLRKNRLLITIILL